MGGCGSLVLSKNGGTRGPLLIQSRLEILSSANNKQHEQQHGRTGVARVARRRPGSRTRTGQLVRPTLRRDTGPALGWARGPLVRPPGALPLPAPGALQLPESAPRAGRCGLHRHVRGPPPPGGAPARALPARGQPHRRRRARMVVPPRCAVGRGRPDTPGRTRAAPAAGASSVGPAAPVAAPPIAPGTAAGP